MPTMNKSADIKLLREFDAPLNLVWDAWADPEQVAKWWGPRGFTITTESKDFRVGGTWKYVMHGPDGKDYPNLTKYLEIEPHKKMVYDHGATETTEPMFRVTVLFSESNGKTKMDMTMTLSSPEAAENTRAFIKKAGGDTTWDRLAEFLEKTRSGKDFFVINRSFEAPIELMWEMWVDPKHIAQWLAPTGFTMNYKRAEVKEGGTSVYEMSNGAGVTMYGQCHYLEFHKPTKMIYTQEFLDEKGNISRHPFAPTWPESMKTIVYFTAEGPNQTRVTINWQPWGNFNQEEVDTFIKSRGGMTQGFTGSFDKLDAYLEQQAK